MTETIAIYFQIKNLLTVYTMLDIVRFHKVVWDIRIDMW